jgi:hypothetical protein
MTVNIFGIYADIIHFQNVLAGRQDGQWQTVTMPAIFTFIITNQRVPTTIVTTPLPNFQFSADGSLALRKQPLESWMVLCYEPGKLPRGRVQPITFIDNHFNAQKCKNVKKNVRGQKSPPLKIYNIFYLAILRFHYFH